MSNEEKSTTDVETAVTLPTRNTTSSSSQLPLKEPLTPNEKTPPNYDDTKINLNNILNLVGFFLSLSVSYVGGVAGWFGGNTNVEVYAKYVTLITPSNFYYEYIWGAIFLFEGFFAVTQLLPAYRKHPLVQSGIGPFFFLACLAQSVWQIFLGYEIFLAASAAVFGLLLSLLSTLMRQYNTINEEEKKRIVMINAGETDPETAVNFTARSPTLSYWLLRFPFALHAGWVTNSLPLVVAMAVVQLGWSAEYELWISCISVPLIFGCCLGLLLREELGLPSYVFPLACAYNFAGVAWQLYAPSTLLLERHEDASITLMKNLSGFCAACILVVMASRSVALIMRDQWKKFQKKDEVEEIDGVEYPYIKA